jgi:4-methyl-5(b-hydroxyethyl)-thiazole monophosphate biosynthesis
MAKVLVILAEGFEEIEAVTIIDVLRRADVEVTTAALGDTRVRGAHALTLEADKCLDDVLGTAFDAVILPGGMPGSRNLRNDARVLDCLRTQQHSGRFLGAICAAPIALEAAGVLKGKRATCYPGYELPSATFSEERVVCDENVVTSRGPGTAIEFSLEWVKILAGPEMATRLREGMIVGSST